MKKSKRKKSEVEDETTAIRCLFTQFALKGTIKKFGEDGENAGLEEIQQLHDRSAFNPVDSKQFSREKKTIFREFNIHKTKKMWKIKRSKMY